MSQTVSASSLYECTVLHERFAPKRHRFSYRLFYFVLDLDELEMSSRRLAFFSLNRANLFNFREHDFLPIGEPLHNPTGPTAAPTAFNGSSSLKSRVRAFCSAHGADFGPDGRVLSPTQAAEPDTAPAR